jgi:hypothetical protein
VDLVMTTADGRRSGAISRTAHRYSPDRHGARRRSDRNEHRIGVADVVKRGCKRKPLLRHVGRHELGEAGLEDRNFAALERRDPPDILVDAGNVMTEIGETSSRNKAYITGADDHYAHRNLRNHLGTCLAAAVAEENLEPIDRHR